MANRGRPAQAKMHERLDEALGELRARLGGPAVPVKEVVEQQPDGDRLPSGD